VLNAKSGLCQKMAIENIVIIANHLLKKRYIKMENKKMIKMFNDEREKDKYLQLCEDLFDIAEDFNREEYDNEALIVKNCFKELTADLSDEDIKELNDSIDRRGL
jgi:hypothetical protein